MKLANDKQRCIGTSQGKPCEKRDECARYIHRFSGGEWTPMANTCHEYKGFIKSVAVDE